MFPYIRVTLSYGVSKVSYATKGTGQGVSPALRMTGPLGETGSQLNAPAAEAGTCRGPRLVASWYHKYKHHYMLSVQIWRCSSVEVFFC
jgi:hypothetical protein